MKNSQGEIFGIALMFVVIIVGIIIYSQVQALKPDRSENEQTAGEYEILAKKTLSTVLDVSTGCYVERGKDRVRDLVNFCLDYTYAGNDPKYACDGSNEIPICSYVVEVMNQSMFYLFNGSDAMIGPIPFVLSIDVPANPNSLLSNITLSNFGSFRYKSVIVNESNYRALNYKKAPSEPITWATSQRNIVFELFLYYK